MSINPYIFHCCKRCARKRNTRYLPRDIVFQFLLHLPAQFLHDVVRHVCREWSLVISSPNFIQHHLRNSSGGVIIQEKLSRRNGIYVEMRRGCLEICKFDCGVYGLVRSSCNGLVVISDESEHPNLYVTNPLTKQWTILPPFSNLTGHYWNCGLAFVESSMEYKMVRMCRDESIVQKTRIAVLTIGVDEVWRHIDINFCHSQLSFIWFLFVTGGYVHWTSIEYVLTLNVETEIVRRFPAPQLPKMFGSFLPMGGNLSYIDESSKFSRDVWEMNSVTGEWTMLFSFDSEPLDDRFKGMFSYYMKSITPRFWLVARELLVFSLGFGQILWIVYNVKTSEIQSFELEGGRYHSEAHVNSLVWLE
ncbi:F-box protein At5g49610-like [Primulina eburnea]|uniref:F-box protein At5g49610-like n=1 Tax=Primulina eburnea TaxID=1245227 RepID=UPI003C6CB6AD